MIFAIHLSDGVLTDRWLVGGWVAAVLLVGAASWRIREDEVPRIGVLSAAFFVASQIHLKLGVVGSVHLLLNGLVGVVLGRRAPLAIGVGVLLQTLLFAHGGVTTLGINIAVYSAPALAAGVAFRWVRRSGVLVSVPVRFGIVAVVTWIWLATAVTAGQWERCNLGGVSFPDDPVDWWVFDPAVFAGLAVAAGLIGVLERRLERDPEFPLGLLLGAVTGYTTVGLNALVLWAGGLPDVKATAGVVLLAHLPVVAVESVGVGFVVAYLARAKPEWLGPQRPAGSGKTSSNGTSH